MLFGSMWFSSSHDCGIEKWITAFVIVVNRAGKRLMYWNTVPGAAVWFPVRRFCKVPVTIRSRSPVPVTTACQAFESPPMFTVRVMGGRVPACVVVGVTAGKPSSFSGARVAYTGAMVGTVVGMALTATPIYTVWSSTVAERFVAPLPAARKVVTFAPSVVVPVPGENVPDPVTTAQRPGMPSGTCPSAGAWGVPSESYVRLNRIAEVSVVLMVVR